MAATVCAIALAPRWPLKSSSLSWRSPVSRGREAVGDDARQPLAGGVGDEAQREIQRGVASRAGGDALLDHVEPVGDVEVRRALGQRVGQRPVRGAGPRVQQPGLRQHRAGAADAGNAGADSIAPAEQGGERRLGDIHRAIGGEHEQVTTVSGRGRARNTDRQAAGGLHRRAVHACQVPVELPLAQRAVGAVEDLGQGGELV